MFGKPSHAYKIQQRYNAMVDEEIEPEIIVNNEKVKQRAKKKEGAEAEVFNVKKYSKISAKYK